MKFAAEIPGDCFQIMFTDRKLKSKIMGQSFEWQPANGSLVTDTNRKFLWVSGSIARCQLPWKFLAVHEVQMLTDSKWCHSFTTVLPKGYLGISYKLMSNLTHKSTLLSFRCVNDFLFLIFLSPTPDKTHCTVQHIKFYDYCILILCSSSTKQPESLSSLQNTVQEK